MSLIDTAETVVAPYLTWIKLGAAVLVVVGIAGAGFYTGYRWELGKYETLAASNAQAQTKIAQEAAASQAQQDAVGLKWSLADQKAKDQIAPEVITLTKEIPTYVHDQISCPGPTVGLARVLRAAASGVQADTLTLAPGQSDDDCSDFTPSEVAGWFNQYAGAARSNTQQLSDLEGWVADNHNAQVVK